MYPDQTVTLIQSCLSLKEPNTRRREIEALEFAMQEIKLQTSQVVTLDEEEKSINVSSGTIHIIPAWKFLLTC